MGEQAAAMQNPVPKGFELHDMRCATCPEDVPKPARHRTPWYRILYVQVLIAIGAGIAIGYFFPHVGVKLKPLGDIFIGLIKMMIAPVIFCTIVHGIASMSDLKSVGRVAVKALVYFEAVSTVALIIGIVVAEIVKPGRGFNINPATLDPRAVATYVTRPRIRVSFLTCWRSCPDPSSARSPMATSFKSCLSPSLPA